jgi:hypothetical protein
MRTFTIAAIAAVAAAELGDNRVQGRYEYSEHYHPVHEEKFET